MGRCIYGSCGDCEYYEGAGTCLMFEEECDFIEGPNGTRIKVDTDEVYIDKGPAGWIPIGNVDDDDDDW